MKPLLARSPLRCSRSCRSALGAGSLTTRDVPLGARAPAVRGDRAVRSARRALARHRRGRVPDAEPRRPLERLARAAPEAEDLPIAGSEQRRAGWRLGNPWWTGWSTAFELPDPRPRDARCGPTDLELRCAHSARRVSIAGSPPIITRQAWAREREDPPRARRATPRAAARGRPPHGRARTPTRRRSRPRSSAASSSTTCRRTAGTTSATTSSSTARPGLRGPRRRDDQNVIGAHAQGFNTGSVGIALIGTTPRREAVAGGAGRAREPARVAARRRARRSALALVVTSRRQPAFAAGTAVTLRAISGHRDTGSTSVPAPRSTRSSRAIAAAVAGPACRSCTRRWRGSARRPGALHRAALGGAAVDGDRDGRRRGAWSPAAAGPADRGLELGLRRRARPALPWTIAARPTSARRPGQSGPRSSALAPAAESLVPAC